MPNVGFQEIVIILILALVVFGPKRLPEIGKSLGQGLREFKKMSNELTSSLNSIGDEPEEPRRKYQEEVESKEGDD